MSLLNTILQSGGATFNLGVRILYLPLAIFSWLSIIAQSWKLVFTLFTVGLVSYGLARHGLPIAAVIINTMNESVAPIWNTSIAPILGPIRDFCNAFICWYDGIIIFPYLVGRNQIFPILKDGGFLTMMMSFGRFVSQVASDLFLNYFATGHFLARELDYVPMFEKWQDFYRNWQNLFCYGCEDLCSYYKFVPIAVLTSDQFVDPEWGNFLGKSFNGAMLVVQQVIYIIKEFIWPSQAVFPRANFSRSFKLWCEATNSFRLSLEHIMQKFWDSFVPHAFVWDEFFCFIDTFSCIGFKLAELTINIVIHSDDVIKHFTRIDSTYWKGTVKEDFKGILNLFGPASYFDDITMDSSTISSYQLLTNEQGTPLGKPNPVYNLTTVGECLCITLNRIICDPQANGTTCEQQYNGTLLSGINPCCWSTQSGELVSNIMAMSFEFTLHIFSVNDFIQFLDKQPFGRHIRTSLTKTVNCFWQFFRIIRDYGFCVERIFAELTIFAVYTGELVLRLLIALLTVPYYNKFLPNDCNFITCSEDEPLNTALYYLTQISNTSERDGLSNCFCYVLNNGFNVPFAGCSATQCKPSGYLEPSNVSTTHYPAKSHNDMYSRYYTTSVYDLMSKTGEYSHKIHKSKNVRFSGDLGKYRKAGAAFHSSFDLIDKRIQNFATRIGTCSNLGTPQTCARVTLLNDTENVPINCTDPLNPTPNPVPCFGLCCLPVKVFDLVAHLIAFAARALNAGFQTRFGDGSSYFDGTTCLLGAPCLSSDITMAVVKIIAPIDCICQFIKLFLPSQGFGDPCCAFHVLGELLSVVVQILINIGNSIAGDPDFIYIKGDIQIMNEMNVTTYSRMEPQMIYDFDIVLTLALRLFDCICDFLRTIFAVAFQGNQTFKAFDPCCIVRVFFRAILETARLGLRVVLVMSTLESKESQCFIYTNDVYNSRPGCPFAVEELGIVIQFREIIKVLFAPPKFDVTQYCSAASAAASLPNVSPLAFQNSEGLATCACNTANALLAMVFMITSNHTGDLTQEAKCSVNLCCPIYGVGKVTYNVAYVMAQVIATFWQNWRYVQIIGTSQQVFVPMETLNYFFCSEYDSSSSYTFTDYSGVNVTIPNPGIYPDYPNSIVSNRPIFGNPPNSAGSTGIVNSQISRLKCGKLEPALQALAGVLGKCMCTPANNGIINVLDDLLAWLIAYASSNSQIFPNPITWPKCLCNGGPKKQCQLKEAPVTGFRLSVGPVRGIVVPLANALIVLIRQVVILVRNCANPTMWSPAGGTLQDPNYAIHSLVDNYADIKLTWVNRFLAPLADALAVAIVNAGCTLNMVLGMACVEVRYDLLASLVRYIFEAVIRVGSILEGAIKMLSQEQSGLCVGSAGSNGNADTPSEQGSTGEYGQLVPTCSQKPAGSGYFGDVNSGIAGGGRDTGQVGRILNSALTFVFDAAIGIARLGCTAICPSFNATKVTQSFESITGVGAQDVNFGRACECWNKSPYTGLTANSGKICSFELCDLYFNSGYGSLGGYLPSFTCGGGTTSCSLAQAMLPPNTGLPKNSSLQQDLNDGACNLGCSNDPDTVMPGKEVFLPVEAISWISLFPNLPFVPVKDIASPVGFRCEIVNIAGLMANANAQLFIQSMGKVLPTVIPLVMQEAFRVESNGASVPNPMYGVTNLTALGTSYLCDSSFTFREDQHVQNLLYASGKNSAPFFGACFLASLCGTEEFSKWVDFKEICAGQNVFVDYISPSWYKTITPSPIRSTCAACRLGVKYNLTYSGIFEPEWKRPACTRETCIITHKLCKNDQMISCVPGGYPLDGIFVAGIKYFTCLMRYVFGDFPANLFDALGSIISLIWQISGGIIRLAVYLFVYIIAVIVKIGTDPGLAIVEFLFSFVPLTINGLALFGEIFTQNVVPGFKRSELPVINFDNAVDCVDTELCLCRVFNFDCDGNFTVNSLLDGVRARFKDQTTLCGSLIQHIIDLNVTVWTDIPYSNRYDLSDCIGKRMHGEYISRHTKYSVPADIFYNIAAVYRWFVSSFGITKFTVKEERKEIVDRFKKNFFISRDHFARLINSRGNRLQKYYRNVHQMTIGVWPLAQIELFHYKYLTGYYHYLYDEMSWSNAKIALGTPSENLEILSAEYHQFSQNMKTVTTSTAAKLKDMINTDIIPKMPSWPKFSGPMFNNIKEQFHFPSVRINWPTLEDFSIWPRTSAPPKPAVIVGKRIIASAVHAVWPYSTSKEHHEKFIVGGNCRIVDGVIYEGSKIVDYCLRDAARNIPELNEYVGSYLNRTSHMRSTLLHHGTIYYTTTGSGKWKRPKVVYAEKALGTFRVHRDVYHRAHAHRFDPTFAVFNLFGIDIIQTIDIYFKDFKYWMANKNMQDSNRPDVGAKYWINHLTICKFPSSLDCSYGIGLWEALKQVGLIYLIVFAVLAVIFPPMLSLLSFIFNFLTFLLIVSIVAFNYSPACVALFPTSTLGSTIYTIPILPIPLNIFPAIPMCLWDETFAIVDKIFATCYDWIPQSVLNNEQCGAPVSFPDCATVGILSPLEVTIYWAHKLFGSIACDVLIPVTSLIPYFGYAGTTCHAIDTASPTQMDRQLLCAGITIGLLAWVLLFAFVIATFITTVVLAVIGILHAFILLVPLLPFYEALIGMGSANGIFLIQNEDEGPEGEVDDEQHIDNKISAKFIPKRVGIIDKIANLFITRQKQEKLE